MSLPSSSDLLAERFLEPNPPRESWDCKEVAELGESGFRLAPGTLLIAIRERQIATERQREPAAMWSNKCWRIDTVYSWAPAGPLSVCSCTKTKCVGTRRGRFVPTQDKEWPGTQGERRRHFGRAVLKVLIRALASMGEGGGTHGRVFPHLGPLPQRVCLQFRSR